jgi:hypothetical protein
LASKIDSKLERWLEMELLALALIVALITLVWVAVVPDEQETAPALLHSSPNEFALDLARRAARRSTDAAASSAPNGMPKAASR